MKPVSAIRTGVAAFGLAALVGCGGDGSTPPSTLPTPPPTPAVTITGAGESDLVIHPSADSRFAFALETPVRLTETTGGTADWNFARLSVLRGTTQLERYELTAVDIEKAGFKRIAARSNNLVRIVFRINHDDFDRLEMLLGFGDLKDGRQFTVPVTPAWAQVTISLTPLSVPTHRIDRVGP
jgi:hypothetical protein